MNNYILGIDISNAQPLDIDWSLVLKSGIQFVYPKATEGINYTDPKFATFAKNAKTAGLAVGAYHYLHVRHNIPQDADKQADQFCDVYMSNGCTLIPMLDCEIIGNSSATPTEWLTAIRMWVKRVGERLNCAPIIYTYPSFWAGLGTLGATAEDLGALKLWIAHYTNAPQPMIPKPWTTWTLWQYAADAGVIGTISGVPGHVDRDRLVGSLSDITLIKLKPSPKPTPTPEPTPPTPAPLPTPVTPTSFWDNLLQLLKDLFSGPNPH